MFSTNQQVFTQKTPTKSNKNIEEPLFPTILAQYHHSPLFQNLYFNSTARHLGLAGNHPHTLQSLQELAVLYKEQGDYDKAEPLLLEAIEGRRLTLGNKHPHTLESMKNLITLYEAWNKPEEAEKWRAKLPKTEAEIE